MAPVVETSRRSCAGYAGQVGYTDADTLFGIAGPVRLLTETEYAYGLFVKPSVIRRTVTRFRPNGNRLDACTFDGDGRRLSASVYAYDEEGRRTGPRCSTKEPSLQATPSVGTGRR